MAQNRKFVIFLVTLIVMFDVLQEGLADDLGERTGLARRLTAEFIVELRGDADVDRFHLVGIGRTSPPGNVFRRDRIVLEIGAPDHRATITASLSSSRHFFTSGIRCASMTEVFPSTARRNPLLICTMRVNSGW